MKRIGLLGCGTIGTQIAQAIDDNQMQARLTHVYDVSKEASAALVGKLKTKPVIVENPHLLSYDVDMVVEAASQDAVRDVGLSVLQNKRDLMVMSSGALLDESVYQVLSGACRDFKRRIYLPSGAIAGLDGIRAVRTELEKISITTTKHPKFLSGAKFFENRDMDLDGISTPTVIFKGTAREAVRLFPANTNVSALLSLSGIGSDNTLVSVVADPDTDRNTHRITAWGTFGKMSITVENVPDPSNPKTSRLAVLSAIQTLKEYCSNDIRMGT